MKFMSICNHRGGGGSQRNNSDVIHNRPATYPYKFFTKKENIK